MHWLLERRLGKGTTATQTSSSSLSLAAWLTVCPWVSGGPVGHSERGGASPQLAGRGLGVTATARNWSTVTTLLAMADETE